MPRRRADRRRRASISAETAQPKAFDQPRAPGYYGQYGAQEMPVQGYPTQSPVGSSPMPYYYGQYPAQQYQAPPPDGPQQYPTGSPQVPYYGTQFNAASPYSHIAQFPELGKRDADGSICLPQAVMPMPTVVLGNPDFKVHYGDFHQTVQPADILTRSYSSPVQPPNYASLVQQSNTSLSVTDGNDSPVPVPNQKKKVSLTKRLKKFFQPVKKTDHNVESLASSCEGLDINDNSRDQPTGAEPSPEASTSQGLKQATNLTSGLDTDVEGSRIEPRSGEDGQTSMKQLDDMDGKIDVADNPDTLTVTGLVLEPNHYLESSNTGKDVADQISLESSCPDSSASHRAESISGSSLEDSIFSFTTFANASKEAVIQSIIRQCKAWFESRLIILAYQCHGGSSLPSSTPTPPAQGTDEAEKAYGARKRARMPDRPGDENDRENEGGEGGDKGETEEPRSELEPHKYACPFLKHNFNKYRKQRGCLSGRPTTHRIKEHIYRNHRLPKFKCSRCCEVFTTSNQLLNHQRAPEPCGLKIEEPQDGINEDQVQALRSRKRPRGNISEEEKWAEMYKIIFPDDDRVPSPYHDFTLQELRGGTPTSGNTADLVVELGEHASRELPRLMRPRLEDMLDRVIEESLSSEKIVDLAKGVFQEILQSFHKTRDVSRESPGQPSLSASPAPAVPTSYVPWVDIGGAGAGPAMSNEADPGSEFCLDINLDFEGEDQNFLGTIFQDTVIDSFGAQVFDFGGFDDSSLGDQSRVDSGYASIGPHDGEDGKGKVLGEES
ncbi:hypothetical protein NM208_g1323 [Fusarium decemcellulare]|uniref:Uncharacterized protein n=1 Tax=Fusarium decemcellulare TaxID=57161 RepID=A0ACC1SWJ0_9HYPO|nr:hypothetical protein NM208_g1323 [Fusarium decemcellulare]